MIRLIIPALNNFLIFTNKCYKKQCNELERLKWIIACCSFFQNIWQSWCTSYASIRGPRWWSFCCDVAKECAFVPAHHQHRQRLQRQEQQCEVGERIGGEDLRRFILDKCRPLLLLLVPSSDDAEWTKDWWKSAILKREVVWSDIAS